MYGNCLLTVDWLVGTETLKCFYLAVINVLHLIQIFVYHVHFRSCMLDLTFWIYLFIKNTLHDVL